MLAFLLVLASCPAQASQPIKPAVSAPTQIVVIGASLSAGFGLRGELDADFDLARTFELAIKGSNAKVHSLASAFLFTDPLGLGSKQVDQAIAREPDLIIALDFAFWFGHGAGATDEQRMQMIERGLSLIDDFNCPLLLGDLPDVTSAAKKPDENSGRKAMISKSQLPSPDCLARINTRLHQWASGRPLVQIYPLHASMLEQHSQETVRFRDNVYDVERKQTLIQADLLHSTYRGTALVALKALDALVQRDQIKGDAVEWDATLLEQAIWQATEEERGNRRRKRTEREERKRAREEKREQQFQLSPPR
ncbi:MAG: hypothetical protein ACI8X5_001504 [Planctomycetota bacterium]|jgi:hypothetical protein